MSCEIVALPVADEKREFHIKARLEGVIAILRSIDLGELLSEVPSHELQRSDFNTALTLLAVAERELNGLFHELNS